MADLQHTALTSTQVHEPKHITANGTAQSGQVITNSSSTAATSEYRKLDMAEVTGVQEFITHIHPDSTSTETHYLVSPIVGTLLEVRTVIDAALTGADNVYTVAVDGVNVTPATLTITQAASAAGDVDTLTVTAGGTLTAGSTIEITGNGGNTAAAASTYFVLTIQRA